MAYSLSLADTGASRLDHERRSAPITARLENDIASRRAGRRLAIARGLALFLGGFTLLNLFGDLITDRFDANIWWIDLRPAPHAASRLFLPVLGALLLAYGVRPRMSGVRRWISIATIALALAAVALNVVSFYAVAGAGTVTMGMPIPFSLAVGLALLATTIAMARRTNAAPGRQRAFMIGTVALCLVAFPTMQMLCFGMTDYRRPADVAVVFGARAYADGSPSTALADRVRTGCRLYREGVVRALIFSGGPGDGAIHETESMRRMAISLGVHNADIIVDTAGLSTYAIVQNTAPLLARSGGRVLAVSHFYHLPRVKMTYQRSGLEVYTVPAEESRTLVMMPYLMLREIAALWAYYLGALWR